MQWCKELTCKHWVVHHNVWATDSNQSGRTTRCSGDPDVSKYGFVTLILVHTSLVLLLPTRVHCSPTRANFFALETQTCSRIKEPFSRFSLSQNGLGQNGCGGLSGNVFD